MKTWFRQVFAIAKNSFAVVVGDPVTLITHLFIVLGALAIASLPGFSLGGQLKSVWNQALGLSFLAGCLLASVGAAKLVSEDIRKGMTPTIMSRPVSTSALLGGKWLGLVVAEAMLFLSAAVVCLWASRLVKIEHMVEVLGLWVYLGTVAAALLATAAMHYIRGGNYVWQANIALSAFLILAFLGLNTVGYEGAKQVSYGSTVAWNVAPSYLYLFMATTIFSAIICALAVEMDVASVLACAAIVFFAGLFSGYFLTLLFPADTVKAIFAVVIPDWQIYWTTEMTGKSVLATGFMAPRAVNAALQSILFLAVGTTLFEKREISGSV